ncbi:hypothetical protein GETHOR_26870 [Geothrix oryzae]|uniref:DUF2868 domain-containing protein n=1 Tax=Geothrix oryzae TaxID=2927975 RepID=A0ABN6V153_9BACT|nr:hypothetical protein [Geothrix oryzae]BDU70586.1 hypothetical protein GETHOR_26870 [Geothrix oryzae]
MNRPSADPLAQRLEAWGHEEIRHTTVRWTPEFLQLRAWLARGQDRTNLVRRIERGTWMLTAAAGAAGLGFGWPLGGWATVTQAPLLVLPPFLSLGLLGRSLWVLMEAET